MSSNLGKRSRGGDTPAKRTPKKTPATPKTMSTPSSAKRSAHNKVKLRSDYIGVVHNKLKDKWKARYVNGTGKRMWVPGDFDTEELAAKAHDKAVRNGGYRGQMLNFPTPAETRMRTAKLREAPSTPAPSTPAPSTPVPSTPAPASSSANVAGASGSSASELFQAIANGATGGATLESVFANPTHQVLKLVSAVLEHEKSVAVQQEKYTLAQAIKERQVEVDAQCSTLSKSMPLMSPATPSAKRQKIEPATTPSQPKAQAKTPKAAKKAPVLPDGSATSYLTAFVQQCAKHPNFSTHYDFLQTKDADWLATSNPSKANSPIRLFALDCEMVIAKGNDDAMEVDAQPSPKKKASKAEANDSDGEYTEEETDDEEEAASKKAEPLSKKEIRAEENHGKANGNYILARVSLLEWTYDGDNVKQGKANVVMDEYVKPPKGTEIVDFLTHVSGVTKGDLDKATLSLAKVQKMVAKHVTANDVLVGHSLFADLRAIKISHSKVVDTSLLFKVEGLPKITLSLKDVAGIVLADDEDIKGKQLAVEKLVEFQKKGESHDSLVDAEWSARVLMRLVHNQMETNADQFRKTGKLRGMPLCLQELPERFQTRLTVYNIPPKFSLKHVARVFKPSFPDESTKKIMAKFKPIKWITRRTGDVVGSTVLEMDNAKAAQKVFKKVEVDSDLCHPDGYPEMNGFQRKVTVLGKKKSDRACVCDIGTFFRMVDLNDEPDRQLHVRPTAIGKVLGPKGRRVIEIQKRSGTQITMERLKMGEMKKNKSALPAVSVDNNRSAVFNVWADSETKAMQALKMIHSALKGELFGVDNE